MLRAKKMRVTGNKKRSSTVVASRDKSRSLTRMAALSALAALGLVSQSRAANAENDFSLTAGAWLTGSNWSLGLPTAAHDAVLPSGTTQTADTITNGNMTVGSLVQLKAGTITLSNASGAAGTNLSTLTLGGSGSTGNGVSGTASTDLLYVVTGGTLNINGVGGTATNTLNLILGQSGTFNTAGTGTLNISSNISGGFSITKTGSGTMNLSGTNSYTGGLTLSAGTLALNSATAIGTGNLTVNAGTLNIVTSGGGFNVANNMTWNGNFTLGTPTKSTTLTGTISLNGPITVTTVNNAANLATIQNAINSTNGIFDITKAGTNTLIYAANFALTANQTQNVTLGTLRMTGNISGANFGITTAGAGTLQLTGVNTYSGATAVVGGSTLNISGSTAGVANSDITVLGGGILSLDSAASGGTTRSQSVTLRGGTLTVAGNSGGNTTDIIGNLTIELPSSVGTSSANVVTLTGNVSRNATLSATNLIHAPNTAVLFRGTNLGNNTIGAGVGNTTNIVFTNSPSAMLVGGTGGAGSGNIAILPWAVGDASATGTGSSFVTYDANGIRPLNVSTEYDTTITPSTTTTNNVMLTIAANGNTSVAGAATVNSLFISGTAGNTTLSGAGALTVTSGAVYGNYGAGSGITISKQLDFGSTRGYIGTNGLTNDGKGLFLTGGVSGNAGLTIYNTPTMIVGTSGVFFNAAATYTGDTYITGGALVGVNNFLPNFTDNGRTGDVYVYGRLTVGLATNGSFTINGLYGNGSISFDHTNSNRRIIVGDGNATSTFDGTILGNGGTAGLTKKGTGTLILTNGGSTYQAATIISGGVLQVTTLNSVVGGVASSSIGTPSAANGNITLGNATLTGTLRVVGTGETTDRGFILAGNGTIDQSGTGLLRFTGGSGNITAAASTGNKSLTLQGSTAGTGQIDEVISELNNTTAKTRLVKDGTGTWSLTGASTYSGGTTVLAGKLLVNNTTGSATGTGNVSVSTGATFGGNGTISGKVTTGGNTSIISAGNSPGNLTIGSLDATLGARIKTEIGSTDVPGDTDHVVITGLFTGSTNAGGLVMDLVSWGFDPAGPKTGVTYTLVSFNTSLGLEDSDFSALLTPGLTLDTTFGAMDDVANGGVGTNNQFFLGTNTVEIRFSAVPEPTSLSLLGLGAGGLLARRRRAKKAKA